MPTEDGVNELIVRSFNDDDEPIEFMNGKVESVNVNGTKLKRATMGSDWNWENDEKELVGTDSCQNTHTIYVVTGQLGLQLDDGTETILYPGDVAKIPSGHTGWTAGEEELIYVDFDAK